MKRALLSGLMPFLSVVLLSGCQDRGTDPLDPGELGPALHGAACKGHHSNDAGCGGGGGGDPAEDTPLTVTVADRTGGGITNDGSGVYSDGVDLVVAHLRPPGIGTVVFETAEGTGGKNSPQPIRLVCMDFSNGTLVNGEQRPFETSCVDVHANTPGGEGELDFHTMEPVSTASSGFQMFWNDGTVTWFLRYDAGCGDDNGPNGYPVTVTRTGTDSWTIEGEEAMLCTRPLKGKPAWTKVGDFTMPFSMALVVKP